MPLTSREIFEVTNSIKGFFPLYEQTFVSALNDMLTSAETCFGRRDDKYSVTSVRFIGSYPRVKSMGKRPGSLVIYLSFKALQDIYQDRGYNNAIWQLAHEVVHLLSRTEEQYATVLEEGLACCFQRDYIGKKYGYEWPPETWMESYREAYLMTRDILERDADIIRKLRLVQPTISLITADAIREQQPEITPEIAEKLVSRFIRGKAVQPITSVSFIRL